jgi:tetratricopeptide (TPR) repeat protein
MWDQAQDNLEKAAARDPEFTAATARLAEACVRKYNASQDTRWLARADSVLNKVAQNRQTPGVLISQGMIWQATGEYEKAASLYRELLQSEPNNVEVWDMLAQTLKGAGKIAEAEDTYHTAVRLRPGYWPAFNTMAVFYMGQHDYQKAEQSFQTAIAMAPDIPVLHSNLGGLYFKTSRWEEAAREFRKSVKLKSYAQGYSNLGTALFFDGKYREAADQFEEAIKLPPANHVPWGNLGDARWQIPGENEPARLAFRRAYALVSQQLVLNPVDAQLHKSIALYLAKLGNPTDARKEIEVAIHQAPADADVTFYAARVYAVIGDWTRAAAAVKSCLALGFDTKEVEREPDLNQVRTAGAKDGR